MQRNVRLPLAALAFAIALVACGEFVRADGDFVASARGTLPRHKEGFFQLSETEFAWIGGGDDFTMSEANTFMRVAVPLPGDDNILALQPALRTFHLNGPDFVDVPETLYCAQLNLLWRKTWTKRTQGTVWLQPKIRSDFETTKDSFFLSGGAFMRYTRTPNKLDIYFGALYLDRDDITLLPGAGFIWTPTSDWRVEALLPRPRISKRLSQHGSFAETWAYLSGQLGGGSFAVTRDSGVEEKLTVRAFRVFFGTERIVAGGRGVFLETGYVFGRTLEYGPTEEFEFDDSLLLRAGFRI